MTHIPNTTMGRLLRAARDERQDAADGYSDGKGGLAPVQPSNERYMRAWREGWRDRVAASKGG